MEKQAKRSLIDGKSACQWIAHKTNRALHFDEWAPCLFCVVSEGKRLLSADDLLRDAVALTDDEETVGGVGNLDALEVVILDGSIAVVNSDVVDAGSVVGVEGEIGGCVADSGEGQ